MKRRITYLRREKQISQRRLAAAVGISQSQLSQIENGHYRPRPEVILKLSRVLGADPSELMDPYDELDET